jgi:hypothetical protein
MKIACSKYFLSMAANNNDSLIKILPSFSKLACLVIILGLSVFEKSSAQEKTLPKSNDGDVTEHLAKEATVMVSRAPSKPWTPERTRVLASLPAIPIDKLDSRFGGISDENCHATANGFFQIIKNKGRWWFVDPEGKLFIHRGIVTVRENRVKAGRKALAERYGTLENWGKETAKLLQKNGFNGTGAWSDDALLKEANEGLVSTRLWKFMASYGKQRGGTFQKPGHTGYPGNCPFIFDPGFADFCNHYAKQIAGEKDDPWLLGHLTDNELPWHREMLDRYLSLPKDDHGHVAAEAWLQKRHGIESNQIKITDEDRSAFLEHAVDRYFSIVCAAIRKYDPNHLILGSRFHGGAVRLPEVFRAAGRHIDVVSVNYYHAWSPDLDLMRSWSEQSGKPILITEWYAKGVDSGMANLGGAGWLVKTQADRGHFYQNFTLGLLESKVCVGWHWFRYMDNDPDDHTVDPSNRDSNKGILSNRYAEYEELLDAMRDLNIRTHGIIRHFDQAR